MLKAVISGGGLGERIKKITGGLIPKSLVKVTDKPLISYQLEALSQNNIDDVYISFQTDWQIQIFKQFVRTGEVPKLNYRFGKHEYGHQLNLFKDKKVYQFLSSSNFIWTVGDLFYSSNLIKKLITSGIRHNSVYCSYLRDNSKGKDTFIPHTPIFFTNDALKLIRDESKNKEPSSNNLLLRISKIKKVHAIKSERLIDMNTISEFNKIKKILNYGYQTNK
jgi:choline kinase